MASKLHQMLVVLIGRKMREEGFVIVAFDGNDYYYNDTKLQLPPTIYRHRPDIVGYNFHTREVCIGEAKTGGDLRSKRTREQLSDYSKVTLKDCPFQIRVILGIPKECEKELIILLRSLNISKNANISYIWMPGELCYDGREN